MRFRAGSRLAAGCLAALAALIAGGGASLLGTCGPFTDVAADAFCPFVLEVFYMGITTGTTPTTYDPTSNVSRLQMAAFLSRTVDGVVRRGSRRSALDQFWNAATQVTTVGTAPIGVKSDGLDVWVANNGSGTVSRVRASDGKLVDTWTGSLGGRAVVCAGGKVNVVAASTPNGTLYHIDPLQPPGAASVVATNLGDLSRAIAFDGSRLWTANNFSVSIVTPTAIPPWTVTTVTTGFGQMGGVVFDGSHIWATDGSAASLVQLGPSGAILQTVTVGALPQFPVFDGTNIWVPNFTGTSISIVRASTGAVLATLTGNGLSQPASGAFDGQRVLITSNNSSNVSLWKAADLTPLGFFDVGANSSRACSDGIDFWITQASAGTLVRF